MALDESWLASLNDEQRQAATFGADCGKAGGPLLVIAGAGSGKTNTLAHRVAHLILRGADPERILLLTFSRRAASEMTRRVETISARALAARSGRVPVRLSWSGTFHAIGARLLRTIAEEIGLAADFTILDREDSADLMNLVRHDAGLSKTRSRFPTKGTCLAIYSRVVNTEAPLTEVLRDAFPWCASWEEELKGLFAGYVSAKQEQGVLDYDDLLLYWAHAMAEPALAGAIAARFDHILVDEYQDTNRLQASILMALKPDGRGVTVVGDDAQSIYSFRAATVRNILAFPANFDPPATVVTLDRNYRSTRPILDAANAVIGLAAERFTKNLHSDRASSDLPELVTMRDEAEQARFVADRILDDREVGMPLKQQAVLFRASHHSAPLELELTRRNIPFVKFGGLKFLEAAHVKDVLACLRFAQNPRDRSAGFRLLQLLPGIGPRTASQMLEETAVAADPMSAMAALPAPPRAEEGWAPLMALLAALRRGQAGWPGELAAVRSWYRPHLERIHEDADLRAADLAQLEQIAGGYPSRERFLTEITLDPPEASSDEAGPPHRDEDYLILSTIHSAKGQEWRSVFVLNSVDGCIPSDLGVGTSEDIEEERRLLYVAMTRAKDRLTLCVPQRFYVQQQRENGDRHMYAVRTRFIPDPLLAFFAVNAWPASDTAEHRVETGTGVSVDIRARMRGMWH